MIAPATASGAAGSWGSLSYAERLHLIHRLTAPAITSAIDALALPPGSWGLDAGCGAGTYVCELACAVAPGGRVVGLDLAFGNLVAMPISPDPSWLSGRVVQVNGNLQALPFRDRSFDWVWCADTLWPDAVGGDPVEAVRELARVVRGRGTIALLFWSGQTLLPGYPQVEARLGVAFAEHVLTLTGLAPLQHHLRALAWLQEAGLEQARARTFVAEVSAPLAPKLREALAGCFEMLWGGLMPHLGTVDRRAYDRLCSPDSSECILDHPGYHALVTYTLFAANRPRS